MCVARRNWRWLFLQFVRLAHSLALTSAGRRREARIAMIAMTTSSSIRVKARNTDLGISDFMNQAFASRASLVQFIDHKKVPWGRACIQIHYLNRAVGEHEAVRKPCPKRAG